MRKAFPETCFLVNHCIKGEAGSFKMTFRGEVQWCEVKKLPTDSRRTAEGRFEIGPRDWSPRRQVMLDPLFNFTTWCDVREAFLIMRPYVRQMAGSLTGSAGELRFLVDGETLAHDPIDRFVIHDDQDPRLDLPLPRNDPTDIFYGAPCLDGKPGPFIGHFLPNATNLRIDGRNLEFREGTILEVGVIAGRYGY